MAPTEGIRTLTTQVKFIITIHTGLLLINSYAHQKIDLLYSMIPYMPLLIFFCLAPLLVAVFLSTKVARQSAVVLLGILPAILVYNIVTRFTAMPMFYNLPPSLTWKIIYEGSYGLILIMEIVSFWFTFKILRETHRQVESPSEDTLKL